MADTIFDIPEICLLIAKHLSKNDLASACRVRRSWFAPFASELWRSIDPDQWTNHTFRSAFPRYSAFIRELRCGSLVPLDVLGLHCTQLTLLHVPGLLSYPVLERALQSNPRIEELRLRAVVTKEDVQGIVEIFRTMVGMKMLKTLSFTHFKMPSEALEYLLDHLSGLQSLEIDGWECKASPGLLLDPITGLLAPTEAALEAVATRSGRSLQPSERQ
ncbi:hypothetical protein BC939DRAFT_499834 [Gamsiella multidivaricata]|uniref:uncharacterized protein n=1 Tax=Gamsiella multidivaricata TaxID=101098 RepID=UPI00221F65CB|nr:uncharacterized protein BC939DRAFT_499834 [Gamsiella multidivaricata]KAI7829707.1 hypothetical protein BC939DRAFT_499834 [Gamsiella multidivaricata]